MASDGALIVDTSIDNSGFKRGANEFKRAVDGLKNTVDKTGKGMAETANGYVRAMNSAKDAAKGAAADQAAIAKEIERTETALKRLEEKLDTQRRKFEAARDAAEQKAAAEFSERTANYELLPWEDEAQAAEALLNDMAAEIKKVSDSFGEFEDTAAFRNLNVEIEATREKLDTLKASYQDSAPAEGLRGAFDAVKESVSNALASLAKMAGSGALSFLKKLASGAKNAAIQLAKLAGRAVQTGLQMVAKYAATAAKSMLGLRNSASAASSGFKMGLGNILKYGVGISSVSALFKKLRTAITESFNELASRNPEVNAAVTSMQSALSSLKASFASAFAPIYTAVAPAITYLINLLSSAISTLASFFAALTGSSTVSKAISSIGSSASKSAGSVDKLKRALAGFDTLNVLNDNSSSSGGGSGGGGGSGTMYTTEQIESSIQEFVAKLKDLWTDGQYEEIGKLLAEGINKAFEHAKTLIAWENVSGTVESTIDAITGVFNGLIDGVEWTQIGETFGAGADTIIRTVNRLFAKIKFAKIGMALANMLNGLVSKINPQQLGKFLTNKVNAAFNILRGFVLKFKWGAAGVKFGQTANALFKEIDWDAITTAINEGAKGALEFGTEFLNSFDESAAATNLKNAINKIDWDGIAKQAWDLFKLAVAKLGNFLTVLFDGGETTPFVKPQIDKHAVEKAMTEADKAAGGSGIKVDVSPEGIGTALSTALHNILTAIGNFLENLPWEQWGKDLGAFLASIDWIQLGNDLARALGELLSGLDELVSAAVYGENYQENDTWRALHPRKAEQYDLEQLLGYSPNDLSKVYEVLNERGINIDVLRGLQNLTELPGDTPELVQMAADAAAELDEIKREIINTDAPEIAKRLAEDGATNEEIKGYLEDLGLTSEEAIRAINENFDWSEFDKMLSEVTTENKATSAEPDTEIQSELLKTEDLRLDAAKKEAKTTNALTKALKNKAAVAELTIDLEGNEDLGDLASGKATTTVKVGFTPEGQKEEDEPKGLLDWLQAIFDPGIKVLATLFTNSNSGTLAGLFGTVLQFWALLMGKSSNGYSSIGNLFGTVLSFTALLLGKNKNGYSSISNLFGTVLSFTALLLGKNSNGYSSIGKLFGTILSFTALLSGKNKNGYSSISTLFGTVLSFTALLFGKNKNGYSSISNLFGTVLSFTALLSGKNPNGYQSLGAIFGTVATFVANLTKTGSNWATNGISKWFGGGSNPIANFIANLTSSGSNWGGKKGNGSVVDWFGKTQTFIANLTKSGSNWSTGLVQWLTGNASGTISLVLSSITGSTSLARRFLDWLSGNSSNGIPTVSANVSSVSGVNAHTPAMANGTVMPYDVAAQIAKSTLDIQNTLDSNNNELITSVVSAISNAAASIVMAMNLTGSGNGFSTSSLTSAVIDEINRMTRMNGQSPILGV